MTNILIMLSILLNVVALFCIVILYLRQNRFLQVEKKQEKLLSEMEEVISSYLIEMTEENEKFIKRVRETVTKSVIPTESTVDLHSTIPPVKEKMAENDKVGGSIIRKGTVFQAVQAYKNIAKKDESERVKEEKLKDPSSMGEKPESEIVEEGTTVPDKESTYYQALLLKKQGLTTEDIARRLNKGKTEIELLFKLRQNDQE